MRGRNTQFLPGLEIVSNSNSKKDGKTESEQ